MESREVKTTLFYTNKMHIKILKEKLAIFARAVERLIL